MPMPSFNKRFTGLTRDQLYNMLLELIHAADQKKDISARLATQYVDRIYNSQTVSLNVILQPTTHKITRTTVERQLNKEAAALLEPLSRLIEKRSPPFDIPFFALLDLRTIPSCQNFYLNRLASIARKLGCIRFHTHQLTNESGRRSRIWLAYDHNKCLMMSSEEAQRIYSHTLRYE